MDDNTTRRGGGRGRSDGIAADVAHLARSDQQLAGSVLSEAYMLVERDKLKAEVDTVLQQDHLADANLLGDAAPERIDTGAAQSKAQELIGQNTRTQQMRQHPTMRIAILSISI